MNIEEEETMEVVVNWMRQRQRRRRKKKRVRGEENRRKMRKGDGKLGVGIRGRA